MLKNHRTLLRKTYECNTAAGRRNPRRYSTIQQSNVAPGQSTCSPAAKTSGTLVCKYDSRQTRGLPAWIISFG
ncbi:hypothetical protein TNIN_480471 [Trichonephila inaurata madagascariensis]|uniref:Uncharacterized protein n=1 Tax=Trichonephila inaurata madagascariensis TaxID=2747483 RepID=A0A8X6IW47_9ARAC|nr:hypothetical protein TNIN_480471 [Trichonephila inaurata madagascariensis]